MEHDGRESGPGSAAGAAGGLHRTGARNWVLALAIATTVVVLVTFAFTTLVEEPGTAVALVVILPLGVVLDLGWKRSRPHPLPV